ncbi:uncharacterized protein BDZ99DRAFT_464422 [Mytilinidion resinicola]|uniref:Uncharacterized protein n=1 Tax=Mytilinidion resinicola TaxID=574789 RepID=A0A6A6YL13_9PEZI|nr:uncharacterized protein BDZ99DRAFT_464422 [Mytilinidion resinicola]KAF2808557.1 hypothetical protein BDZ99DRAFT_464422 [Mytilinidion resinicola]
MPSSACHQNCSEELSEVLLASGPITTMPVPGRRCPACLEKGETVWVIQGKCCPECGTPVN